MVQIDPELLMLLIEMANRYSYPKSAAMLDWYVAINLWKQLRSILLLKKCKIWATDVAKHWLTTRTMSQRMLMEERVWIIQGKQLIFSGPQQTRLHLVSKIITVVIVARTWEETSLRLKHTVRLTKYWKENCEKYNSFKDLYFKKQ